MPRLTVYVRDHGHKALLEEPRVLLQVEADVRAWKGFPVKAVIVLGEEPP